jgi:hypothetical protein
MTVYQKFDNLIAEAKCLMRQAINHENESLMSDLVFELEMCKKKITKEQGEAKYEAWRQ